MRGGEGCSTVSSVHTFGGMGSGGRGGGGWLQPGTLCRHAAHAPTVGAVGSQLQRGGRSELRQVGGTNPAPGE